VVVAGCSALVRQSPSKLSLGQNSRGQTPFSKQASHQRHKRLHVRVLDLVENRGSVLNDVSAGVMGFQSLPAKSIWLFSKPFADKLPVLSPGELLAGRAQLLPLEDCLVDHFHLGALVRTPTFHAGHIELGSLPLVKNDPPSDERDGLALGDALDLGSMIEPSRIAAHSQPAAFFPAGTLPALGRGPWWFTRSCCICILPAARGALRVGAGAGFVAGSVWHIGGERWSDRVLASLCYHRSGGFLWVTSSSWPVGQWRAPGI